MGSRRSPAARPRQMELNLSPLDEPKLPPIENLKRIVRALQFVSRIQQPKPDSALPSLDSASVSDNMSDASVRCSVAGEGRLSRRSSEGSTEFLRALVSTGAGVHPAPTEQPQDSKAVTLLAEDLYRTYCN